MVKKTKYFAKRDQLLEAIKIAKTIVSNTILLNEERKTNHLNYYNLLQGLLENPNKEHQNLRSLKYVENDFFYYWNEAKGQEIDKFWSEIESLGLEFKRKDKDELKKILERGKIKNEFEYNYTIDIMVVALQENRINEDQFVLLNNYVGEFENKMSKKKS